MTEYITKEAAIEAFMWGDTDVVEDCGDGYISGFSRDAIKNTINSIPAADVTPVVRCKDCKHYLIEDEFEGGKRYMCEVNHFSYINSDGDMCYCSYGERKEGAE